MRRKVPAGRRPPHPKRPNRPERPGGPPAPKGAQPPVSAGSPAAVLAIVPHLLGFVPHKSLVVIGAGPPRGRIHLALRFDLPDPPDQAAARYIAEHTVSILASQRQQLAVVIGYGPGHLVTPLADQVRDRARQAGLHLQDVLRVEDGRYWSESWRCRSWPVFAPLGRLWAVILI